MGFFEEFVSWKPAMEAEDITQPAQDATQAALRKPFNNRTVDTDEDLITNTDDLLGVKDDPDGGTPEDDTPTNEPENGETDLPDEDLPEGTDADNPEGEGEGEEEPAEDDMAPPEETPPEDTEQNAFEKSRKRKCWNNMKVLYEVIDDSISLLSKYIPETSDPNTIKVISDMKGNLTHAKDITYKILTGEYQTMSYAEMEKKYMALNHVVDLMTEELKKYFDDMDESGEAKKDKKKRS